MWVKSEFQPLINIILSLPYLLYVKSLTLFKVLPEAKSSYLGIARGTHCKSLTSFLLANLYINLSLPCLLYVKSSILFRDCRRPNHLILELLEVLQKLTCFSLTNLFLSAEFSMENFPI